MQAKILCLSSTQASAVDWDSFKHLVDSTLKPAQADWSMAKLDSATWSQWSTQPLPHVIFMNIGSEELRNPLKHPQLTQACAALRSLDSSVLLLILAPDPHTSADVMNWLDIGATALIGLPANAHQLQENLPEILAKRIKTHIPRTPRIPAKHQIKIQVPSLEQAIVSETLNVGHGGIFVRAVLSEAQVGDAIEIELDLSDDPALSPHPLVTGSGKIVWIRPRSTAGMPEGMGIQFQNLTHNSQKIVSDFVSSHALKAFIPKA